MPSYRHAVLPSLVAAILLCACTRAPSPDGEGENASAAGATPETTATDAASPELQAYYAALVAAHGQDVSQCPPAEAPAPGACIEGDTSDAPAPPRRVLLMLDASGSMAARQGAQTKLAVAQDALLAFVSRLEGEAQVALRVYGHRGGNRDADKAVSCAATELVQPFAARDPKAFEAAVRSFQPRGFTPIAASLQAAEGDFTRGGANAQGNVVYLVSDGIETCDGDPAAAARALNASGIRVVVNVIGFDVDAAAERQLRGVAGAGGGEYIAARNRVDLDAAFNRQLREAASRYNCEVVAQTGTYTRTVASNSARYTCLIGKASSEYTAVVSAASLDLRKGRATLEQHDYAMAQAEAKRRSIVEPASGTRQQAVDGVSDRLDREMEAARRERDAAVERARDARER